MRRAHFNQTNKPMTFRTWILKQDVIGADDFKWLKAFDIPITINQPTHEITTSNGSTRKLVAKALYTLDTTTDKQRDMLVLKYGTDVILLFEEYVLPNSMSTCTLKEIKW